MARSVSRPGTIVGLAREYFPSFLRQRSYVTMLNLWIEGKQRDISVRDHEGLDGQVYTPRVVDDEYRDLSARSSTPWAGLIVTSLAQTAYVEGVRGGGSTDNLQVWQTWQRNRMDAKQIPLHRAAIGHGMAFGTSVPGRDPLTGLAMAKRRPISAKRMAAFYDQDDDEWPRFAIEADPINNGLTDVGWTVKLWDESAIHYLTCKGNGVDEDDWTYISYEEHGQGVPPIVRFGNRIDLDGKATGEIEPIIPMLRRLDQGMFDRLMASRFSIWKIRYIAGLAQPDTAQAAAVEKLRLSLEDFLVAEDPDTKFGAIDGSDITQFIQPTDADLRYLAAISQTPPHHLLGLSSNLQAEALAAAEAGLGRKSADFKMLNGEAHEQWCRLDARIEGRREESLMTDMQVRWRDTESRSFVQTVQALATAATGLGIPVEMLWERIPGWTDADTARAKKLIESGTIDKLLAALQQGNDAAGSGPGQQGSNGQGGSNNEES